MHSAVRQRVRTVLMGFHSFLLHSCFELVTLTTRYISRFLVETKYSAFRLFVENQMNWTWMRWIPKGGP